MKTVADSFTKDSETLIGPLLSEKPGENMVSGKVKLIELKHQLTEEAEETKWLMAATKSSKASP